MEDSNLQSRTAFDPQRGLILLTLRVFWFCFWLVGLFVFCLKSAS